MHVATAGGSTCGKVTNTLKLTFMCACCFYMLQVSLDRMYIVSAVAIFDHTHVQAYTHC